MVNLIRIRTIATGVAGSPYYTNLHFVGGAAEAQQAATDVYDFWNFLRTDFKSGLSFKVDAESAIIDSATGLIVDQVPTTVAAVVGADAGDLLPPQVQGLVRLRTPTFVGGRRILGRFFLPGFTEAKSANGQPDTPTFQRIDAAAKQLMNRAGSELCVYSPTKFTFGVVTQATAGPNWSTLRSRSY